MSSRIVAIALAAAALASCGDPAHDNAVNALGPEKPGVSPGPTHRPGQPCVICHGGSGPGNPQFSIGGTVYAVKGQTDPLVNATVHLTDATGSTRTATTNAAGNFYITLSQWAPLPPIAKISVDCGPLTSTSPYTCGPTDPNTPSLTATMNTHIGRDGSCAGCHFGVRSATTPGPIYVASDPADLPMAGGGP